MLDTTIIVDTYQGMDSNRIPLIDYRELVMAHNVNLNSSDEAEEWFDFENDDNLTTMSDTEWFDTFVTLEMVEA
jgi:hypothetical protein